MTVADILAVWTQPAVLRLAGLGLISVLLWRIPGIGLLFYPFRLFNTFVHELSHGLAAILTGGRFRQFVVHPGKDGLAHIQGGLLWFVAGAGYLGSALFGGLLLLVTTTAIPARSILLWLGMLLAVLCVAFVRNLFGMLAGLSLAALLAGAGWYLSERYASGLLLVLAIQMMLSALNSVVDLIRLSAGSRAAQRQVTDAQVMARITGIPAVLWALLWCVTAIGILVGSVTLTYHDNPLL